MPASRRLFLTGLSAIVVTPVLAACGGSDTTPTAAGSSAAGSADAFPVTIPHKFGETTITTAPTRVVCVGLVEQDALLALGIVPVAVTKWFGEAPGQIFSWATDQLGGSPLPEVLDNANGTPIEKVAALAPDLIIGQYAGITQKEYDLLSKIAPTVAQPGTYVDYGTPWDESTLTIGKAIGKSTEAQTVVDEVNARIEKEAADHPEFAGKQAACVTPYEGIFIYGPEDPRDRMLSKLGFVFPEILTKDQGKEFGWSISAERVGELEDVDAVVWLGTEKEVNDGTGKGWANTTASKEGRGIFINDSNGDYYIAQSMVTPLSIPYVLDRYVPQLAAAADGDPASQPESPTD